MNALLFLPNLTYFPDFLSYLSYVHVNAPCSIVFTCHLFVTSPVNYFTLLLISYQN